jgi:streptogramin lyase
MRACPSCTRSGASCETKSGHFSARSLSLFVAFGLAIAIAALFSAPASAQSAGQNVNMVSGMGWTNGDPFLERQNEPSIAVSTRNVSHLFGAANDYRSVDLPGLLGIDERGDAWLGVYKSFDGGLTWQSTLLPGFPLDGSPEGLASPIHGRQAAADPLVRSGSNGLFFLTGIAFDRGTGPLSKVFISRFIDLNNKENGDAAAENGSLTNLAPRDPVKYIDTHVIDSGTPSRFLDKPWVAVDIPRGRATCTITANEDGTTVTQRIPAGAIYVTYTAFTTVGTVQNSQILFRRSTDCGVTWSKPIVLSQGDDRPTEQDAEGQGTVIAIDPSVPADQPARIYVAWRVFAEPGDPDDSNKIMIARSSDGGQSFDQQEAAVTFPLSCNKKPTGVGCPFDQDETGTSFRSNGYPALTVDPAGRIYLAWSQRDRNGDGRIMMTVMNRVQQCISSSFREIDSGPVYDDNGNPFTNLSDRGSQLMPTLNFNAGKLMLTYYDLRQDHTSGALTPAPEPKCNASITPLCPIGNPFSEFRQLEGELVTNPMAVFNAYVDDATLTVRRHTLDIVGSESSPESNPFSLDVPSFTHFRVSHYEYGIIPPGTDVDQAQFNAPNLPMFVDGTAPFMGDYIDVAGAPTMVPDNTNSVSSNRAWSAGDWENNGGQGSSNGWKFNTSPTANPVFHATWTDNRDVQPPPDGVSWDKYTPPISASIGPTSKFDPTQTPPACVSGYSGMRNQNIYTSAISHGLILTSPQTAKPVLQANGQPIPREFSLVMRNDTTDSRTFQLKIPAQPSGAQASFLQFSLQTTLTINIPALSSASRPVFLTPKAKSTALFPSFEVDATETDGAKPPLTASILFNADPTNPVLANPDGAAFGSSSISSQEFYNPAILNPAILNPAILNPAILNPAILNPAILNPAILNPAILNPAILNPNFVVALNPAILNPAILNPAILNNAVANPAILNPAILNTPVSDANYTITNEGNTSATYQLQLFQSGGLPASAVFQIVLTKTYLTPGVSPTDGCTYGGQVNNEVLASIDNPAFVTNPAQLGNPAILNSAINNPTFSIAPGDTVQITLRANLTVDDLANLVLPNLTPVVASQGVNTVDVQQGITTPPISLLISTAALPAGVTGQAYSTTLTALGGNPPVTADTWSLIGGSLPPGLNLSVAGVISGTPTTVGTFPFVVEVMDTGAPQHVASRQFSITVVAPVAITTPALPPAAPGAQYTQVITASGGVPPYTFTSTGTLPPGLTLSSTTGVISGIPTTAGTYTFTVMVSDSMGVFATQTYTILISTTVTQPAQVAFVVQPSNIVGSQAISPAVQVQVTDVTGAAVPGAQVAINFANPACPSATLSGTLTGTTNANGIASFANLTVDHGQRGYTIAATAGNSSAVSNAFNVEGYCETGSMNTARHNHIVLGLPNGKILITGGAVNPDSSGALASAELYDPVAHTFTNVGPMNVARADHTATLLPNGKVLIAGGFNDNGVVSSAELFDPVANTFTLLAAPMTSSRAEHTATLLANGKVLIAGGNNNTTSLGTAEIFDPTAGTFTATSHSMTTVRQIQHADLLPNGRVLISGGFDANNNALASAEIYDPNADTFTATGGMTTARGNHGSALLYNGQVLVAGGLTGPGTALVSTATAELYNPATGLFTPTGSMSIPRGHYAPTILNDGTIFIQGGATLPAGTNADVYNLVTGTFRTTANFTAVQAGMRDAILPDGTVLLASGVNSQSVAVPNSEVFYPLAAPASITITAPALPNAAQNQPYTQLFLEFGGVGNLTWSVASGALPPGLALSTAGILAGTPTANGTFTFAVTVVDSASPAKTATTGTLSLTVSAAATTLVLAPQTLPTALTNAAYTPSIVASGGTPPYSFVVSNGAPPSGITLATSGAFSGTATTVGSFSFGVTVTDSSAPVQTATQSFTIQAANPLAIATTILPAGTAGTTYSANISTTGGVLPVGFGVTAGALPPGLALSLAATPPQTATLSGTPTTAGTFTFTITAADSASPVESASQSYTVNIASGITNQTPIVTASAGFSSTVAILPAQIGISELPVAAGAAQPGWITVGPDGNFWFTDNAGKVWRMTLSGIMTPFSLTSGGSPGRITSGPDGNLWFTELLANRIGRITPSGVITEFTVPTAGSDPSGIVTGADGNLWFTEQATNKIGRITPSGTITEFAIPTGGGPKNGFTGSEPIEITAGPDGNVWFTEYLGNKIANITPAGVITEFAIPTPSVGPFGIALGRDGNLWFTEQDANKVASITLGGAVTEFPVPTVGELGQINPGPDGSLWFCENTGNRIGRVTTAGVVTEFVVPTSGSGPGSIVQGPDGNMWFTETNASKIGKINPATGVAFASLTGTVSDDGLPLGATLSTSWSLGSENAPVSFGSPTASFPDVANQVDSVSTAASFTAPGTYLITLTGSDSQLSASANVTITVLPLLVLAPQTLPTDFTSITSYAPSLVASGGTPPYSFAVTSGSLPAGITLGSNGTFNGASTAVGSYPFGVTVTDSSAPAQTATQTFTIQVAAALAIATSTLPGGTAGTPYTANISSTGGVTPVGFTVTSGTLPPGLQLGLAATPPQTATLSGTPTTAGTFNFTITASDSSNPTQTASQSYTVTIAPAAVAPANVVFAVSPQNSVEGQILTGSPVKVVVTDSTNTPIANAAVSIGLNGTPPCAAATLGGTLTQTTDATGTATFPDLTINRGQYGFALAATAGTTIGASIPFNVEGFCDTGSLATARVLHSSVVLPNGTILIAGGAASNAGSLTLSSAELYNPATHAFTAVGSMNVPRNVFTMTLLRNGLVLVAGGLTGSAEQPLSSAELFNPATNTFTLLSSSMVVARGQHTATLLPSGKVLIAGGLSNGGVSLASAELFDPVTNTFTATSHPMTVAHNLHEASLLPSGQVLISGGITTSVLTSAELYDPVADTFTATGSMATPRFEQASALLYTGNVLVAGGITGSPTGPPLSATATSELYSASAGTFSSTASATRPLTGFFGPVPVLSDGTVFLDDGGANANIYDPTAGTFRATGSTTTLQAQPQSVELPDGTILVAGGSDSNGNGVANAEIFYPINVVPVSITSVLPTALVNVPYSQQLLEKGGVGALTWTLSSGTLPTGLTLSPSGLLLGTPTAIGVSTFIVQVTDSSTPPRNTTANFIVAVVPVLTVIPELPTANPGVAYSVPLLIAGGAPPYTSSIVSGALPAGLALANGIVSGTTTAASGNYTFTVQVTDSSSPPVTVTQAVTMTVAPPLAFVTTALPGGQANVAYPTTTITTSGGSGAVQIAVESGALPTGLTLSLQGVLSGTPTVASSFTFTLVAVDSSADPQLVTETLTIVIAPVVTPITLGPASLPAATAGVAYSQNFSISGGAPPYTMAETGALPPGLTFNGTANPPTITGTPTLVGTYAGIVVTATDSLGAQAQVTYTITVNAFNAACGTGNESLLNGQYAVLMQGFDTNGPRTLVGSITANGAGGITAGQLDIGTDLPTGGGANQHLTIIAAQSSFSVGPDQRGCLVLTTSAGSSSYRFALGTVSGGTARVGRIIDFQLNGSYGAGFFRLQNSSFLGTPTLSGSYAFLFTTASSLANVGHWSMMGSFNASSGAVSGGSWDYNDTQTLDGGSAWATSGLSFPAGETYSFDATGRGTFQLPSVQQYSQSNTLASANIVVYPVGASEMYAAVLPDANNKPLVGDIQAQVTPFNSLTLNGAGFVDGTSPAPIFSDGLIGLLSASQNVWSLSSDNDLAGTYSTGQSSGTYSVDSMGRAPLANTGSTSAAPILRTIGQNKAFLMLPDGTAASGYVQAFPGNVPPSSVAGSYAFGSAVATMDRKVTNMAGVAVFDSAGDVTLTSDQATGSSQTLSAATVFTSTYSYNASTGRGVIPATGAPHYFFDASLPYVLYLLDVTATDPEAQELDAFGPPAVTLTPDPLNLIIGTNGTMEVLLGTAASGDGQVVTLTSSNSAIASVPPSVTVPAGSAGASFTVTAGATSGSADINAAVAGLPPTNATVNVTQMNLAVSLPGPLLGVGRSFNATVTLANPAGANGVTVTLASSDTTIAAVSPASVTIAQGGTTATFAVNGVATGTIILTASSSGFQNGTTSLTITNSLISLQAGTVTVAPGQSGSVAVSLSGLAPTGGITITFSSGNTAVATVTASVFVPQGQQVPAANPQVSGVSIGSTVITASATGFAPDTAPVQVTVTASFNPTSLSIPATRTNNITLNISAPAPQPNGVTFNLSSDNTNFVTVPATAVIPAGQLSVSIPVTGVAPGSANLSAASAGIATVTAPVNVGAAPTMSVNVSTNLGQNLQVDGESVSLSAGAPANENLTLTSNSVNVLLATTPAGPFSQSITLPMAINSFSVPSFSIQGLASSGTAQLTAQAAGYGNGSTTVTLTPSGIEWVSGNFTTTTFSPNTSLTLASYQLSPTTLAAQSSQNVRTGLSVSVTVTSSDSTMGAIVTSPVTINSDTNTSTVVFHPVAPGTPSLLIATPSGFTTPTGAGATSLTATVTLPNLTINATTNLGQNLQADGQSIGLAAAPPSNETLTLISNSPNLLIANTPAGPFSQSINLALSQGSFSVPTFSMQSLVGTGTAQLTAAAPGYNNGTITINLTPSGIEWVSGNFTTTTFSPNSTLTLAAYQLNPTTLTAQASQNIRTGSTVSITVTSSDTTIGTIVTSPVTINPDTNTTTVLFHPVASGTANLLIATPTGFTTPNGAGSNSIAATVNAPNLSINVSTNLGQNLQVDGQSVGLGAAPPSNETLTLTSNSPNILIANTPAGPFSQSITLALSQGSFSVPGFSMEGLASTGTAQLTASAAGYNSGTATITLTPSGIEWVSGSFNTTTFTPNTTLTLASYQLNPTTLTAQSSQNIRTGSTVSVTVTSSAPTVGTILNSPITISADTNSATVGFHPLTAGTSNLVIATPTGFTTPTGTGSNTITATVSAPNLNINVSTNLGQNLQVDGESIGLAAAPPNNETLTLSSSSTTVLLAATPAGPFSQSITLPLSQGSFSVPGFSMQGLAASGSAQLTAQAPGYTDASVTVALTPSAIEWVNGDFSTTTFTPNTSLTIAAYQLNPATLTAQASQNLRTGLPVSVTVTSSNTAVGTIVSSPVTMNADNNTAPVSFHPVAAGTANLVIATPAGFTTPNGADSNSLSVTVSAPNLNINATTNLGQNLQVDGESIGLAAAPQSSETLTLSSNSPSLLLATTAAGPFSQSITLPLTAGSFSVPGFSIQGLASSGAAQLTATAPGYNNGTITINLTPSAIEWLSGNFTTTTFSPNTTVTLAAYQLNPANLTAQNSQNIRTGLNVSVTVTTSDSTIGTIVTSPVTLNADTNTTTILFHPVGAGSANVLIATPTGFTTPNGAGSSSITATVSAPNLSINVSSNLGQNLQVDGESIGLGAAPTSSETLTLSSNSAALLLATTPAGPFSQTITLPLTAGSFSVPAFSMQGLANTGSAQLTASAPGYNNGTSTVALTPSAIEWSSGSFSTTTFSTDTTLSIDAFQLSPATLTAQAAQNLRTGMSVSVTITSSDTTIGTILGSPVTINPDSDAATVVFHPVAAGTVNLVIATPAGFTTPNGAASSSIAATVSAPNLNMSVATNLGQNLQVDNQSIGLGAAPPTSRTLTLTSGSAALLLSTSPAGPFSQSITLPLTAGSFTVPGFSTQALAGSGTAQITASAPGYSNGTSTITLTPSGIVWQSGSFSTTAGAANTNLTLMAAQLNATTLTAQAFQNIRTGSSVGVTVTSSVTAVGTIVTSPLTINAGADSATVVFDPLSSGVTNLVITTPTGFTTPNGNGATSIAATVN